MLMPRLPNFENIPEKYNFFTRYMSRNVIPGNHTPRDIIPSNVISSLETISRFKRTMKISTNW